MGVEQFVSSAGLAGVVADTSLVTQIGFLLATGFLFFGALVGGAMSWGAARAARRAQTEIARELKATQELAAEIRNLTARAEDLARQRFAASTEVDAPDRAADGEQQAATRSLEAARESATVPSALLGGMLRRRR